MTTVLSRPALPARRKGLLALCGALALALLLALPGPAQAHDTLLETDPADGATLETSPEQIDLTFSADVLEVSPLVRISDADGEQLAEITPSIDGPVATAELPEPLPAGTHTVRWRVVSSDGHPIEGTFEITVEQDPAEEGAAEDAPAASDGGGAEESAPAEDTAAPDTGEQTASAAPDSAEETAAAEQPAEDGGMSMPVLLGILAAAVLVIGGIAWAVLRRRD